MTFRHWACIWYLSSKRGEDNEGRDGLSASHSGCPFSGSVIPGKKETGKVGKIILSRGWEVKERQDGKAKEITKKKESLSAGAAVGDE